MTILRNVLPIAALKVELCILSISWHLSIRRSRWHNPVDGSADLHSRANRKSFSDTRLLTADAISTVGSIQLSRVRKLRHFVFRTLAVTHNLKSRRYRSGMWMIGRNTRVCVCVCVCGGGGGGQERENPNSLSACRFRAQRLSKWQPYLPLGLFMPRKCKGFPHPSPHLP